MMSINLGDAAIILSRVRAKTAIAVSLMAQRVSLYFSGKMQIQKYYNLVYEDEPDPFCYDA